MRLSVSCLRDREVGVDLGDLAPRPVLGLLLGRLGLRLRLDDARLLADARALDAARRVQVVDVVGDVLDLERVEHEPDAVHVVLGLLDERLGERGLVLVHLLGRELREDAADVALERLLRDGAISSRDRPRKRSTALSSSGSSLGIFTCATPWHVERDAALRVRALDDDLDGDVA